MKQLKCTFIVSILFMANGLILALMPPHLSGSDPEDGGILKGNTVIIYGYSLGYASFKGLKVKDTTTGKKVTFTKELDCKDINKCKGRKNSDMPGCWQEKCQLKIKINKVISGHSYEVHFLKSKFRFKTKK